MSRTLAGILNVTHVLIHADDTILLSRNRNKNNRVLTFFRNNKLILNLGKSSFIVINPKGAGERMNISFENGFFKCAR